MPKLSDTQLIILAAAAKRDDGSLLPLPKKLKLEPDAATGIFKGLIKKKLVAERPTTGAEVSWRDSGDGQAMTLIVTEAGLRTIGANLGTPGVSEEAMARRGAKQKRRKAAASDVRCSWAGKPGRGKAVGQPADASSPGARAGTKQAKVVELLRRQHGATIAEMMKATGWQAHSVRGVISGALKKKLGLAVDSHKAESGERRYRIVD